MNGEWAPIGNIIGPHIEMTDPVHLRFPLALMRMGYSPTYSTYSNGDTLKGASIVLHVFRADYRETKPEQDFFVWMYVNGVADGIFVQDVVVFLGFLKQFPDLTAEGIKWVDPAKLHQSNSVSGPKLLADRELQEKYNLEQPDLNPIPAPAVFLDRHI